MYLYLWVWKFVCLYFWIYYSTQRNIWDPLWQANNKNWFYLLIGFLPCCHSVQRRKTRIKKRFTSSTTTRENEWMMLMIKNPSPCFNSTARYQGVLGPAWLCQDTRSLLLFNVFYFCFLFFSLLYVIDVDHLHATTFISSSLLNFTCGKDKIIILYRKSACSP